MIEWALAYFDQLGRKSSSIEQILTAAGWAFWGGMAGFAIAWLLCAVLALGFGVRSIGSYTVWTLAFFGALQFTWSSLKLQHQVAQKSEDQN